MAFKTFNSPLSFAHRVTLLIFILIVFSSRLSQVMATKTGNADKSITFISSELDWSKDLDGIKPYGPSANAANMDPNFGYQAYRALRFKIIRKMISVGPNLWNTMCYYAKQSGEAMSLEAYDGYGPQTSNSALEMVQDDVENAKLCDQRALNILHEFLLPGPWLQLRNSHGGGAKGV